MTQVYLYEVLRALPALGAALSAIFGVWAAIQFFFGTWKREEAKKGELDWAEGIILQRHSAWKAGVIVLGWGLYGMFYPSPDVLAALCGVTLK